MVDQASRPAHHFETIEQEREAEILGIWAFLVSEIMLFGALFGVYAVYRWAYPVAFAEASRHLDLVLGSINTGILLASSLCIALAVFAVQTDRRRLLMVALALTILLGMTFLGIKGWEYLHKFEEGLVPGARFQYPGENPRHANLFFSLYFVMTGLHAFHMIIGLFWLGALLFFAWRRRFSSAKYMPIEYAALYWHFVDVVWVFLFPLLYLIDRT